MLLDLYFSFSRLPFDVGSVRVLCFVGILPDFLLSLLLSLEYLYEFLIDLFYAFSRLSTIGFILLLSVQIGSPTLESTDLLFPYLGGGKRTKDLEEKDGI